MLISTFGGENALIKLIEKRCRKDIDGLVLGMGDDAALFRPKPDKLQIVTTDLLAEGTHFRRDIIDAYSLGWKSVAVNISDVASMGGNPTWTFVSLALPDIEIEFVDELYRGMDACAEKFGSHIVGGDTNYVNGNIVINVTQLGDVEEGRAALRSTAKAGDRILVTGNLGDSLAGLKILLKYRLDFAKNNHPKLLEAHIRPVPRVTEARTAVETGHVSAMMDISDGLACDLGKMCDASDVGAIVSAGKLPQSDELAIVSRELDTDPTILAATGGEDYELLIAVAPEYAQSLAHAIIEATGTKVTDIGEFTDEKDRILIHPDGSKHEFKPGWSHF